MTLDTRQVTAALDNFLGKVAGELSRPVAQAGAQVFVDEVRRRAGALGQKTGNLRGSIYQAFSKDNSGKYESTYHVSWRTERSSGLPRAPHAHLLEYGYLRRFAIHKGPDGRWWTVVRPEMRGKYPRNGLPSRMPLEEKARYLFRLPVDKKVPARPFLHPGYQAAKQNAVRAMLQRAESEFRTFTPA